MPSPIVKGIRGERQRGTPAGPDIPRITCGGAGGIMVYVCEVCESAPATVTCKADAAALCPSCDADIHSANPLARRHLRVPIYSALHASTKHLGQLYSQENYDQDSSWLSEKNLEGKDVDGIPFGGVEVDEYLDLVEYGDGGGNENENVPVIVCAEKVEDMSSSDDLNDSVVPEQDHQQYYAPSCATTTTINHHDHDHHDHQEQYYDEEDVDQFDDSCKNGYPYMGHISVPHSSISMPSLDVGIVPEASMTESAGHFITLNSPMEVTSLPLQLPLSAMDREARVLRYRMKRKNRKFEKTIRYASRKAYAETRPRIKGRFAKRTDADAEVEVDQMLSSSIMVDTSYGLVPSY